MSETPLSLTCFKTATTPYVDQTDLEFDGPGVATVTFDLATLVLDTLVAGVGAGELSALVQVSTKNAAGTWAACASPLILTGTSFTGIIATGRTEGVFVHGGSLRVKVTLVANAAVYAGAQAPSATAQVAVV